jgi:hypothetical protein
MDDILKFVHETCYGSNPESSPLSHPLSHMMKIPKRPTLVCLVPDCLFSRFMDKFEKRDELSQFLSSHSITVRRVPDHVYPFERLFVQIRFPKSKSKRIQKKWRRNKFNFDLRNNPDLIVYDVNMPFRF